MSEKTEYGVNDEKFEAWLSRIDELARKADWLEAHGSYVLETGIDCWRDAYEDGMTPEDAWYEEEDAAADFG